MWKWLRRLFSHPRYYLVSHHFATSESTWSFGWTTVKVDYGNLGLDLKAALMETRRQIKKDNAHLEGIEEASISPISVVEISKFTWEGMQDYKNKDCVSVATLLKEKLC